MNVLIALSSGLFGAFLVFVLGWLKELWLRRRERIRLLRLIFVEFSRNESNLKRLLRKIPGGFKEGDDSPTPLRTDTWEQSRVRLAQLLPRDLLRELAEYYMIVYELNELLNRYAKEVHKQTLPFQVRSLLERGESIKDRIAGHYIGSMS